jgi:hypothetical protein
MALRFRTNANIGADGALMAELGVASIKTE